MAWVITPGRMAFSVAWDLQKRLVEQRIRGDIGDTVLLLEHEPVYTVGRRRGAAANLLGVEGVEVFEIERGGDVTWHGPGQVVAYPIVKLEPLDLLAHLRRLEELMIGVCAEVGVLAERDPRNSGVWSGGRKVGSVGVACRGNVTWHGLALNVDPDLSWFRRINPCGMPSEVMSSLRAEGATVGFSEVMARFIPRLAEAW